MGHVSRLQKAQADFSNHSSDGQLIEENMAPFDNLVSIVLQLYWLDEQMSEELISMTEDESWSYVAEGWNDDEVLAIAKRLDSAMGINI